MRLIRRTEGRSTGRHTWVRQSDYLFSSLLHNHMWGLVNSKPFQTLNPSGHMEVVKLLVSHGAEVTCKDKKAYTPLHAAASSGMISVVKYLLDLGVDVSVHIVILS